MPRRFIPLALVVACEAPPEPRPQTAAAPVASPPAMTPEELAEARRKAGFKDDDLAAEKALTREHGARVHVKANLAAYRALVRGMGRSVADIERSAKRWARSSDPQRAYRRWREQRARQAANLTEQHRALRREADDGRTQALVERTFRQWEDLLNDLGGDVAGQARFAALVAELRASLAAADAALDEIDHDDELEEDELAADPTSRL
ncbi:MAG: hypothetical protein JNL82_37175 [Myxococcales bacterium]|nr:hypothetical protein [Myxococcales bacterium]